MHVLIAVRHRVQAWTIQPAYINELRRRFPHITFLHSTTRETDIELAETADIIFALSLPKEAVARAARLNWLHCSGHAVGHFPLADLAARGITVTNSRGVQAIPIAEHVIAGLRACPDSSLDRVAPFRGCQFHADVRQWQRMTERNQRGCLLRGENPGETCRL